MATSLFTVIKILEEASVAFSLHRYRSDTVMVAATFVGQRVEIDIFENGKVEISRFTGGESVEVGMDVLVKLIGAEHDPA